MSLLCFPHLKECGLIEAAVTLVAVPMSGITFRT